MEKSYTQTPEWYAELHTIWIEKIGWKETISELITSHFNQMLNAIYEHYIKSRWSFQDTSRAAISKAVEPKDLSQ